MTETEWLNCHEPDYLLEEVEGQVSREKLVEFVRRCWDHIKRFLPPVETTVTVVEEFAALAPTQSDHDAVLYADEASLKAARWAPDLKGERAWQSDLFRKLVPRPK